MQSSEGSFGLFIERFMARVEFQAALGWIIQKFFICAKKQPFDYKRQKKQCNNWFLKIVSWIEA